jgi:hypothetical protein
VHRLRLEYRSRNQKNGPTSLSYWRRRVKVYEMVKSEIPGEERQEGEEDVCVSGKEGCISGYDRGYLYARSCKLAVDP